MAKIPRQLKLDDTQINLWFGRIKRAYTARAERFWEWEKINEYRHGRYLQDYEDADRVTGMWHMVAVRQTLAQLYFQYPRMNFTPKAVRTRPLVKGLETLTAYERTLIRAHLQERDALLNNLWYGTGILKFAWNSEFGLEAPLSDNLAQGLMKGLGGNATLDGHLDDLELPQGAVTEHNPDIITGHPWVKSIHPLDFLVDPEAVTYEEARWVAHRFRRPWIEAVNDSRYDRKARSQLAPGPAGKFLETGSGSTESDFRETEFNYQDSSLVTIYEIFDKTTQTVIVLSDSASGALMVRPYPFFGRRGPYVVSQFLPVDDNFWGMAWAETFTPQIMAMNTLRTQMMTQIQRLGFPKGVFNQNDIKEEDIIRVANSMIGDFVGFDSDRDVREVIQVFPAIPINADIYRVAELFKNDMEQISGVTENQLGGGKGVQTATEAQIVNQQSSLRTGDMRFVVDQMLRDSTRHIVSLMKQFWKSRDVIPVIGPDGELWDLTGDQLNFEYDVDIEPGSTERVDRNARMRQSIELIQVLGAVAPLIEQQGGRLDIAEVLREVLQNNDIIKNPDRVLKSAPNLPGPAFGGPQAPGATSPPPGASAVGPFDNVINASESFASGRNLSESAQ